MGNRIIFWSIWAIAILPMIAAVVMYFGQVGVPEGRTHHGELVDSGTQYSDIGLPGPSSPAKWQVVLASVEGCQPCVSFSEGSANFHTALGREKNRVELKKVRAAELFTTEPSIWIVDPLGNVVLRFEPKINPTLILQDLKKLLKLSKVG
ncbi:MAG: hypothetical protein CMD99_03865 [Gammaproteobacteria bacterium]|nr:hypothetical protein [Gammaproteobacteria bacterium]